MNDTNQITTEILKGAKSLISNIDSWCQLSEATDEDGNGVDPTGPYAVKFCAKGALLNQSEDIQGAIGFLRKASLEINNHNSFIGVNDNSKLDPHECHANVLRLFDMAISDSKTQ